jgi:hypothetical protein
MAVYTRMYPVLPGKEAALREFIAELRSRSAETNDFYRRHGVERETCHLQRCASGDVLLVRTEGDDSARPDFQQSRRPFDSWFKQQILDLTGVDPNEQPTGPASEELFDWRAPGWSQRAGRL